MYGSFSEKAQEAWDFARCQRPNGSYYGTGGRCRLGKEAGAKEKESVKSGGGRPEGEKQRQEELDSKAEKLKEGGYTGLFKAHKKYEKLANMVREGDKEGKVEVNNDTEGVFLTSRVKGVEVTTRAILTKEGYFDVAYKVDGGFDAGKVKDRADQIKVARTAHRQFNTIISSLPDKSVIVVQAYEDDGKGASRQKAYEKLGFSKPDRRGFMDAMVYKGRLIGEKEADDLGLFNSSESREESPIALWHTIIFGPSNVSPSM